MNKKKRKTKPAQKPKSKKHKLEELKSYFDLSSEMRGPTIPNGFPHHNKKGKGSYVRRPKDKKPRSY